MSTGTISATNVRHPEPFGNPEQLPIEAATREDFPDAVLVEMSGPNNDTALTVVPWPEVPRG